MINVVGLVFNSFAAGVCLFAGNYWLVAINGVFMMTGLLIVKSKLKGNK